jgi:hypothetical protein
LGILFFINSRTRCKGLRRKLAYKEIIAIFISLERICKAGNRAFGFMVVLQNAIFFPGCQIIAQIGPCCFEGEKLFADQSKQRYYFLLINRKPIAARSINEALGGRKTHMSGLPAGRTFSENADQPRGQRRYH